MRIEKEMYGGTKLTFAYRMTIFTYIYVKNRRHYASENKMAASKSLRA